MRTGKVGKNAREERSRYASYRFGLGAGKWFSVHGKIVFRSRLCKILSINNLSIVWSSRHTRRAAAISCSFLSGAGRRHTTTEQMKYSGVRTIADAFRDGRGPLRFSVLDFSA